MDLLERQSQLDELAQRLRDAELGCGKVVLLTGEAGAGKSALVETFANASRRGVKTVWSGCDSLQTPRALGPVQEIATALVAGHSLVDEGEHSRGELFARLVGELSHPTRVTIVVMEDLHWADEATLDFVRYLGRRIQRTRCLLIATYRDDELPAAHPLRRVLGEMTGSHVTRIRALPLSLTAVTQLARTDNRDAERIYTVTGGNAFFVRELLAAPGRSVPETVRDAVIARVMPCSTEARELAEFVSLSPHRTELWLAESILGNVGNSLDECVARGLLRFHDEGIDFSHELARLAVESTVSPTRAQELHRRILAALCEHGADVSLLVHHAELARDKEAVLKFAPQAGHRAARLGSHREAVAHFAAALRHGAVLPAVERARLLDAHAMECNLTNQVRSAIESATRALALHRESADVAAQAWTSRLLSRLYWQTGDKAQADRSVAEAIAVLETQPPGSDLAMAYATRSMLAMLGGRVDEAIDFGQRALELGRQTGDVEPQVHALNNMGSALLGSGYPSGFDLLDQSLSLALQHELHEPAGRAYTNLTTCSMLLLDLSRAERSLRDGLAYCEEHEIYTHMYYMRAYGARLELLRGCWEDAARLATELIDGVSITTIQRIPTLLTLALVRARRGDPGVEPLLDEALKLALPTGELQRIGRVAAARAEVAWYAGDLDRVKREATVGLEAARGHRDPWIRGELAFWASQAQALTETPTDIAAPYRLMIEGDWRGAADHWERIGTPYEKALALSAGTEAALREALEILDGLGAGPMAAKVRQRLRDLGVRGIPRGPRASTRENPAGLTSRELDVLTLLTQGHTNAEMARRLHLSAKTVDHHVAAILEKLDVRSRTEAATAAFKLDIGRAS